MTIDLPKSFSYEGNGRIRAYTEDDKLIIEGRLLEYDLEQLMYQLTYATKNMSVCFYCGETISDVRKTRSLDHMYPKVYGGVSLPFNMVPSCVKCNREKGTLTVNQYECWKNTRRRAQERLKKMYINKNKSNSKRGDFLPDSWITYVRTDQFPEEKFAGFVLHKKYGDVAGFYKKHHHYLRPVIMSGNGEVLMGKTTVAHAIKNGVNMIPTIILDNVIVKKKEKVEAP